jgi:hypothetical protein
MVAEATNKEIRHHK